MPSVVVVDNYDSFTYNLVQYLEALGAECAVVQHDDEGAEAIEARHADGVLLAPGPGSPEDAGVTLDVIERLAGAVPLLGVCLGHQAIAKHFGARVVRAERLMHGKTSHIEHDGQRLFAGITSPFVAARYHSLVVDEDTVPSCLGVTARSEHGEIMGLRHQTAPIEGVQFHPESILSEQGLRFMQNWLETL